MCSHSETPAKKAGKRKAEFRMSARRSMPNGTKSILPLIFFTVVIDLIGFGIVIPVLPLYAERFGASALQIGLLMGVYSGCQLLLAPIFGRISDQFGRRPVLFFSMIGALIGYLLMGLGESYPLLLAARIIQGVSGANIAAAQAAVADVTTEKDRSRGMGLIGAAFGVGFVLGPLIGGMMSLISVSAPFYFAAGLSALNALLLFGRLPETRPARRLGAGAEVSSRGILPFFGLGAPLQRVVAAYLLITAGFAVIHGIFPLFTHDRFAMGQTANGYLFALIGVVAVVVQGMLIGRLVRRFGEARLALTGGMLVTVSMFLLPLVTSIGTLIAVCGLLSIGNSLVVPTLNGLASQSIDAHSQGSVLGVLQSAGSLGRLLGPLMGGMLYNVAPASFAEGDWWQAGRSAFWSGGILCAIATIVIAGLRRTPPADCATLKSHELKKAVSKQKMSG